MMRALDSLKVGDRAEIESIATDCDRANRLATLGFIPGPEGPGHSLCALGDPISVELDGQEISLRRAEAKIIHLKNITE
jgi:Fe2+ transport system protein FeoA